KRACGLCPPWLRVLLKDALESWELRPATATKPAETGLRYVGTFPSIRKIGGDHAAGQEVSGAGAEFAAAMLSVRQPGDDSLRTLLLESGLPVLPCNLPTARR